MAGSQFEQREALPRRGEPQGWGEYTRYAANNSAGAPKSAGMQGARAYAPLARWRQRGCRKKPGVCQRNIPRSKKSTTHEQPKQATLRPMTAAKPQKKCGRLPTQHTSIQKPSAHEQPKQTTLNRWRQRSRRRSAGICQRNKLSSQKPPHINNRKTPLCGRGRPLPPGPRVDKPNNPHLSPLFPPLAQTKFVMLRLRLFCRQLDEEGRLG